MQAEEEIVEHPSSNDVLMGRGAVSLSSFQVDFTLVEFVEFMSIGALIKGTSTQAGNPFPLTFVAANCLPLLLLTFLLICFSR